MKGLWTTDECSPKLKTFYNGTWTSQLTEEDWQKSSSLYKLELKPAFETFYGNHEASTVFLKASIGALPLRCRRQRFNFLTPVKICLFIQTLTKPWASFFTTATGFLSKRQLPRHSHVFRKISPLMTKYLPSYLVSSGYPMRNPSVSVSCVSLAREPVVQDMRKEIAEHTRVKSRFLFSSCKFNRSTECPYQKGKMSARNIIESSKKFKKLDVFALVFSFRFRWRPESTDLQRLAERQMGFWWCFVYLLFYLDRVNVLFTPPVHTNFTTRHRIYSNLRSFVSLFPM